LLEDFFVLIIAIRHFTVLNSDFSWLDPFFLNYLKTKSLFYTVLNIIKL